MPERTETVIRITDLEGKVTDTRTRSYMATADRVAFERQFDRSWNELAQLRDQFDEDGKPKPGADLSGLRDEWILFFCWRAIQREADPPGSLGPFDEWVETVESHDLDPDDDDEQTQDEGTEEDGAEDPTVPARRAG